MRLKIFRAGNHKNLESDVNKFLRGLPASEILFVQSHDIVGNEVSEGQYSVFIWLREDAPTKKKEV